MEHNKLADIILSTNLVERLIEYYKLDYKINDIYEKCL